MHTWYRHTHPKNENSSEKYRMLQVYIKEEKYFPQTEINLPRFSLPTTGREFDITEHEDCSFFSQSLSIPDGP